MRSAGEDSERYGSGFGYGYDGLGLGVEEHGRIRPSSLLNPPHAYASYANSASASPVSPTFAFAQSRSASTQRMSMLPPTSPEVTSSTSPSMQREAEVSGIGKRRHSLPSMMFIPPTPPQAHLNPSFPSSAASALPSTPTPTQPTSSTSGLASTSAPATLPRSAATTRAKRGRSQLYISNDTRWAESLVTNDSFYLAAGGDEAISPSRSGGGHSPSGSSSSSSNPSPSNPSPSHPSNPANSNQPNTQRRQSYPFSPTSPQDRTSYASYASYASNGSNGTGTDRSSVGSNGRVGVPEGLLRPDLRTFVLGLRAQDGVGRAGNDDDDDLYGVDRGGGGGYPVRRGWDDVDGESIGSLRDHVDYSRPIGALLNHRMPSTTTFGSDYES
ncbi:hypothetical protein ONZ45_g1490 [Pleurotus djamor]|nr:hypothetical protein ONZ45_g1490 [Pleurotus djamor]